MKNNQGFTLIELIIVIVILGVLAAVAIPRFTDLSVDAHDAAAAGIAAAISSASARNAANCQLNPNNAAKCTKIFPNRDGYSTHACTPTNLASFITDYKAYGYSAEFIAGAHQYTMGIGSGDGDCSSPATTKVECTIRGYNESLGTAEANQAKFKKSIAVVRCTR